MTTVGELRELLRDEDVDDSAEVYIVEFGYRSRNQSYTSGAAFGFDKRKSDDWGREKEGGVRLYIGLGGTAGNRYPPFGEEEFEFANGDWVQTDEEEDDE